MANFSASGQQLSSFNLPSNYAAVLPYGPHPQAAYQALQDPLHQVVDQNSPEVFKNNIRLIHRDVLELESFARRVLLAIQNAYQHGNSPAQTEADILNLKQMLSVVIEKLRQSGVGALPIIPPSTNVGPSESQLETSTRSSLHALHEKLQRSQDSAAMVANLLTTDHQPRAGK